MRFFKKIEAGLAMIRIKNQVRWLFSLFIAIMLFACGDNEETHQAETQKTQVKTAVAKVEALGAQSVYSGTVEALERIQLSTKIMGWLEELPFAEGESFQKGDLLVKLSSKDVAAKVAQAEAGLAEANTHFNNTERNLKRVEALFAEKAAPQKELEDMRAAFASAKARKLAAERMKAEVDELARYASIRAPFAGRVARKMVEIGNMVNPGHPVLEIENADRVKVVAKVSEREVQNLHVGMPVTVSVEAAASASNGSSPKAKITRIVPAADPVSRQFEIQVELKNPDGSIKTGMFARVAVSQSGRVGLVIPESAVFRRGQLQGIFVLNRSNNAQLRWVRVGAKSKAGREILAGLNPGEIVVVNPSPQLLDGQSVEVVQ